MKRLPFATIYLPTVMTVGGNRQAEILQTDEENAQEQLKKFVQGEIESRVTKLLPNQAKAMAANVD